MWLCCASQIQNSVLLGALLSQETVPQFASSAWGSQDRKNTGDQEMGKEETMVWLSVWKGPVTALLSSHADSVCLLKSPGIKSLCPAGRECAQGTFERNQEEHLPKNLSSIHCHSAENSTIWYWFFRACQKPKSNYSASPPYKNRHVLSRNNTRSQFFWTHI